jgi:RimJ/RimL family protein N-acetyltransferase
MSPDWPLETERLTLRPYQQGDFDALYALQSNEEVVRWLYNEPRTSDEVRENLQRKITGSELRAEGDWLSVAVVVRESGVTVGDIALHWVSERDRTAEVGFTFLPAHHGHGYATEAARAIVGWAFDAGFRRVIGRAEPRNVASARVLEKLGMRLEAHLVENEWVKGEWQSEVDYAILEREWRS